MDPSKCQEVGPGEFAAVVEKSEQKKIEGATAAGLLALRLLRPLIDP
jgi:hypothetical protein